MFEGAWVGGGMGGRRSHRAAGGRHKISHGGKGEGGPIRVCLLQALLGRKTEANIDPEIPLSKGPQ